MNVGALQIDRHRDSAARVRELESMLVAAEEKLARTEEDLARVLDSSHTCIYETGPDLRFTHFAGSAHEALGADPGLLLGRTFEHLLSHRDNRHSGVHAMMLHHKPFENQVHRTCDETRHIKVSGEPLFDGRGNFCGYRGTARTTFRQLNDAIESIPTSLLIFDADDRLVICNSVTQRFFPGAAHLLVPGTRFEDLLRADIESGNVWKVETSAEDWIKDRVKSHRAANADVTGELPDGRWIHVIERPTTDGGIIGIRMDITELKQTEAALKMKAHQLEKHGKELERSNTELAQFAYVASHDLQEPLRMVASYCQLLKRRYQGKLDSDADEFIGYAVEGASRMQRLINDLLSYSRVGRKGDALEPLAAAAVVKEALSNLEAAIAETGASIHVGELADIIGDRMQLIQLFQNLIGNAIKFRREESPTIRITAASRDDFAEFTVEDNGIGIEREYIERVFLIFQRLHDRAKYSGTGIGLAIAKKVVEHHGGQIWIDSTPGQGSRFHFTLPTRIDQSRPDA
jgi:signal transduction histidine kinase